MQFFLAILLLSVFAAVYAVGIIVAGIVELVKYIKFRKEEARKNAELEAQRISEDKNKASLSMDDYLKSTNSTKETPQQTLVSGEEESSYGPIDNIIQPQVENLTTESPKNELAQFNNVIYHVKLLGHEDPRFQLITIRAYEIISKFGESQNFFSEIINKTEEDTDFATEIIRFIVIQKSRGVSDTELIKKLRIKYITKHEAITHNPVNVFHAKPKNTNDPIYIETETSPGSRQLTAKSKIAHKHKAIQYANVIGGKLIDAYYDSGEPSFFEYVKKQCKTLV